MKKVFLCFFSVFLLTFCGCNFNANQNVSDTRFLFDTFVTITLYDGDQQILDECFTICDDYEKILSKTKENSDVYKLNNNSNKFLEVSDQTVEVIEKSIEFSKKTNGAFDITVEPLLSLWDFKAKAPKVPDQKSIEKELLKIDYNNIVIDKNRIMLKNNAQIDLGGIAKGYIADKLKEFLEEKGVKKAIINIGGNIVLIGENKFNIGIQKPFSNTGEALITVAASDCSIVTSGNYQRYFEKDGKIYHHIIDTSSGYPVNNNLSSVTVISEFSVDGDCLSTACYSLGLNDGLEFVNSLDGVEAVFVDENNKITISDGLEIANNQITLR